MSDGIKKLAVLFPGIGYHCDKPLLYYGGKLAMQMGYAENIRLSFNCDKDKVKGKKGGIEEAFAVLYTQAKDQLKDVDWTEYDEILFLSKSIGTVVAAAYAKEKNIKCKQVFMTPLALTFAYAPKPGIAFTGTADNWVDYRIVVEECDRYGIPLQIYDNANHSLETEDLERNLQILGDVMQRIKSYV